MADCTELEQLINDLAMDAATLPGVENLDDVVAVVQSLVPGANRQVVVDAINGVIDSRRQVVTELSQTLAAIRNEARTDKNLQKKAETLTEHLEAGTVPEPAARRKANTEAIRQAKGIVKDLKAKVKDSIPARKKQINAQIKALEAKLAGPLELPTPKTQELTADKELAEAELDRDKLARQLRARINSLKPRGVLKRLGDPVNTMRALLTSYDFSAVFRQGGFIVLGNPVRGAKDLVPMFKAWGSERATIEANNALWERPIAVQLARAGVDITPVEGGEQIQLDEGFPTELADKIPIVRRSQRAYVTFLNHLRFDTFEAMVNTLTVNGEATLGELRAIGGYINAATGRPNLGRLESSAVALNTFFFAPRLVTSRLQLLTGHPLWGKAARGGTARTRKLIATEYAKYMVGLAVTIFLGKMAGGEVEEDPRSADFGSIRFGSTRVNYLSGIGQMAVLVARVATGEVKSTSTGEIFSIRGEGAKPYGTDVAAILGRGLRYKFAPAPGLVFSALVGKDPIGRPLTFGRAIAGSLIPITFQEMYEAFREEGIDHAAAVGLASTFGFGVASYGRTVFETPAEAGKFIQRVVGKKPPSEGELEFVKKSLKREGVAGRDAVKEAIEQNLEAQYRKRAIADGEPDKQLNRAGRKNRRKAVNDKVDLFFERVGK